MRLFNIFFSYSDIGSIDIFKSFFGVRFEAKGRNFGLLHNFETIDAIFSEMVGVRLRIGLNLGINFAKKRQFWGGILLIILSKIFFGSFYSLCRLGLMIKDIIGLKWLKNNSRPFFCIAYELNQNL